MKLIESIYKEPEKWRVTQHWFIHDNGAKLWVDNGFEYCTPEAGYLGYVDRWRAWKAYRAWCKTAPVEKFGNAATPIT